jgi:hypothetical protein
VQTVVRELIAAGWTRAEIIDAFKGQDDFELARTEYQVDNLLSTSNQYGKTYCKTLKERCSKFIDCEKCELLNPTTY